MIVKVRKTLQWRELQEQFPRTAADLFPTLLPDGQRKLGLIVNPDIRFSRITANDSTFSAWLVYLGPEEIEVFDDEDVARDIKSGKMKAFFAAENEKDTEDHLGGS